MADHQRINELFTKYLNNTCSPAEWEELRGLVAGIDDADTDTLSEPLLQLWQQASAQQLPTYAHLIDREKMYAAITSSDAATPSATPVRRLSWWHIAAAAIVLGIAALAVFYLLPQHPTTPAGGTTTLAANIGPAANKATLTLAGGQQITLDNTAGDTITDPNGIKVINLNNSKLAYNKSDIRNPTSEISYHLLTTPRGGQYQLVLADGSKVWLNAASSIYFPTAFAGKDRTVTITGEAYFEVAKNATQPFRVKVKDAVIEVLGTEFNINAYTDEATLKTSLLEGAVKVSTGTHTGLLAPGQEASIQSNNDLKIGDGNVALAAAWKNGYFQFEQAPLPAIMRQIGRWYDLDIQYAGAVPDREFQGKLQRSLPLSGILNLLQKGDVHFTLEGKKLTVLE